MAGGRSIKAGDGYVEIGIRNSIAEAICRHLVTE